MERSGATAADFAQIAVKAHRHGTLNPKAQYREEFTADAVMASRTWSTRCAAHVLAAGDGAAALVLARTEASSG